MQRHGIRDRTKAAIGDEVTIVRAEVRAVLLADRQLAAKGLQLANRQFVREGHDLDR